MIIDKTMSGLFGFGGKIDHEQINIRLSELGQEGWELVSSVATAQNQGATRHVMLILKREII